MVSLTQFLSNIFVISMAILAIQFEMGTAENTENEIKNINHHRRRLRVVTNKEQEQEQGKRKTTSVIESKIFTEPPLRKLDHTMSMDMRGRNLDHMSMRSRNLDHDMSMRRNLDHDMSMRRLVHHE